MRRLVAVLALSGLLAACGGDDDDEGSDPAPTDEAEASETSADLDLARAVILRLEDLPPGWESSKADDDEDEQREQSEELAECIGVPFELVEPDLPSVESPDFVSPNDEEVSATVSVSSSVEGARELMAVFQDDDVERCFNEAIEELLIDAIQNPEDGEEPPDDLELGQPTFNPISYTDLGDETVAFRLTMPMSFSGLDIEVYLDTISVRVGRIGIDAQFMSIGSPFDVEESEDLVRTMVDRVPAA